MNCINLNLNLLHKEMVAIGENSEIQAIGKNILRGAYYHCPDRSIEEYVGIIASTLNEWLPNIVDDFVKFGTKKIFSGIGSHDGMYVLLRRLVEPELDMTNKNVIEYFNRCDDLFGKREDTVSIGFALIVYKGAIIYGKHNIHLLGICETHDVENNRIMSRTLWNLEPPNTPIPKYVANRDYVIYPGLELADIITLLPKKDHCAPLSYKQMFEEVFSKLPYGLVDYFDLKTHILKPKGTENIISQPLYNRSYDINHKQTVEYFYKRRSEVVGCSKCHNDLSCTYLNFIKSDKKSENGFNIIIAVFESIQINYKRSAFRLLWKA